MLGLAQEPAGCASAGCGSGCPADTSAVSQSSCPDGSRALRCCPTAAYPDVLVWADRGVSLCIVDDSKMRGLDTSLLSASWSNVRELQLLPGARVREVACGRV